MGIRQVLLVAGLWVAGGGYAADIEVVKPGALRISIDTSELKTSGSAATSFRKTLEEDLVRWGWFTVAAPGTGTLVLSGECSEVSGRISSDCVLKVRRDGKSLLSQSYRDAATAQRRLAHRVADEIVWAVRQVRGVASTRLVLVAAKGREQDLYVCDADGQNLFRITRDRTICMSPSWEPDGRSVIYTSYHGGYPDVYRIDLTGNTRTKIVSFPGLNAGADMSPDGRRMVLTLSKDGNPELYAMNSKGGDLKRLTYTRQAGESSPCWSPDGGEIVFVSDRAGRPHLYIMSSAGGTERRLTYVGSENVAPDWGADGRIVYASRRGYRYQLCVVNPADRKELQVTNDDTDHEDPSWGRDGRHVAYTRTEGYHTAVYILDTLSGAQVRLISVDGEWRLPDWER